MSELMLPHTQMADRALDKLNRDFGLMFNLKDLEGVKAERELGSSRRGKLERKLTSSTSGVVLESSGLWSSRGFMGGQVFWEYLEQWKELRGWGSWATTPHFDSYVEPGILLWEVWKRFIEPGAGVEGEVIYSFTERWGDNHLRVAGGGAVQSGIDPSWSVSYKDLCELADEIFPARSDAWLSIFKGVYLRARPDSPTGALIASRALVGGKELIYQAQCEIADALEPLVAELEPEIFEMFLSLVGLGSSNNFSLDLVDRRYVLDGVFTQAALAVAGCLLV